MNNRFWVGHKDGKRTAFTYINPTEESHKQFYNAITGPFKTRQGAEYFANNPYYAESISSCDELAKWTKQMQQKVILK